MTDGTSQLHERGMAPVLRIIVGLPLLANVLLLSWGAWRHSPSPDEVGHLVAGLSHWDAGRFELFRVNPPLVRAVAALPVLFSSAERPAYCFPDRVVRIEALLAQEFCVTNKRDTFWFITVARWACIPFSLIGGYFCYRWALDLYGFVSAVMALVLWCFSPAVIGYGQVIAPDMGAAALGIAAGYYYWRWLRRPRWPAVIIAGIAFGLAQLAKSTWLVLFGLWPALWFVNRVGSRQSVSTRSACSHQLLQLVAILAIGVYCLDLGYLFEGVGKPLGKYSFVSRPLTGPLGDDDPVEGGNRFSEGWLAMIPVPLPENYVLGVDFQSKEFERGYHSYLRGKWQTSGWWYYYLYAMVVKTPLGMLLLAVLATVAPMLLGKHVRRWRDEITLLAPAVTIIVLVSYCTGFNHHMRYVFPAFPFLFVWISRIGSCLQWSVNWRTNIEKPANDVGKSVTPVTQVNNTTFPKYRFIVARMLVVFAMSWSIASGLWIYPHSLSYFNELTGGPKGGHWHLVDSNIDWSQDLLYFDRYLKGNPGIHPLHLAFYGLYDPTVAGIKFLPPPTRPEPGWYALSVNRLHQYDGQYDYFFRLRPVASVGYSIYIYHITLEEANRVRRELGLQELREESGEMHEVESTEVQE